MDFVDEWGVSFLVDDRFYLKVSLRDSNKTPVRERGFFNNLMTLPYGLSGYLEMVTTPKSNGQEEVTIKSRTH